MTAERKIVTRIEYLTLDAWRGLACFWVLMSHACVPYIQNQARWLRQSPIFALSFDGYLGVQIFFVISGYCIANAAVAAYKREAGLKYYLLARLKRIYPPYFLTCVLIAVLSMLASPFLKKENSNTNVLSTVNFLHHDWLYYLSNLTLTQTVFHRPTLLFVFWTLNYEISFYAIVAAALLLALRLRKPRLILVSLHCLTLCSLLVLVISPHRSFFPLDLWAQFGLGVLVYDLITNRGDIYNRLMIIIATIEIFVFRWLYDYGATMDHLSVQTNYIFTLGFAWLLLLLHPFDQKLSRIRFVSYLSWLGVMSYSLYLTHTLWEGMVSHLGKYLHITPHTYWLLFLMQIVFSIVMAYGFYLLFEKPFTHKRKLLQKIETVSISQEIADKGKVAVLTE